MSCCFVASFCQSDKNLSNRHDYLSRLPFASLFIDNSWLITETVSNLQENQSSSWRRPQGAATTPTLPSNAHLCSNADAHCTHMLPTLPSNAHALPICAHLTLKCSFVLKCWCSLHAHGAHLTLKCSCLAYLRPPYAQMLILITCKCCHAISSKACSNSCSYASDAHICSSSFFWLFCHSAFIILCQYVDCTRVSAI